MIFPLPWGVHDHVRLMHLLHICCPIVRVLLSLKRCVLGASSRARTRRSLASYRPRRLFTAQVLWCSGISAGLKEPCTRQRSDDQLRTSLVLFMHMLSTGTRSIKTTTTTSEPSRPFVLPAFLSFLSTTVLLCQFGLPLLPHKRDLDISIHTYRLSRSPLYQTPWSIHSSSRLRP